MPYARKRSSAGGATRAQVAAAIGARTAARFPYSKYGSAHYLRGSPGSVSKFGSSYRAASPYQQAVRKATGFVGRGKYSLPRFVNDAKLVGSMIGMAEPMANRFITKGIPRAMSAVRDVMKGAFRGRGMYTNDNSLIEGGRSSQKIMATNDESDTIILSDCEYVRDVFAPTIASGSSSFTPELVEINPGLQGFAPNLSQIACNYTEYELQQLIFELRPVISESTVNNGQSGNGMMVFNYNPNDDPYDNKEDVMQAHGSVSGRIVETIRCGVECDVRKTNKTKFFVRTGPVPYQKDADEYDMGVLTIATNNVPHDYSNTQIYELYVHYRVLLRKRKAGAIRLNNQQRDLWVCCGEPAAVTDLFINQITLTGSTGVLKSQQNNLGTYLSSTVAKKLTITFPSYYNGFIEVKLVLEGSSLSGTPVVDTTSGNLTAVSDLFGASSASDDSASSIIVAASATKIVLIAHYKVKSVSGSASNSLTLSVPLTAGSVTQWFVDIAEVTQQHWQSKSSNVPVLLNHLSGTRVEPSESLITFLGYDVTIGLSNSTVTIPGVLIMETGESVGNFVVGGELDVIGVSELSTTNIGTSGSPKNFTVYGSSELGTTSIGSSISYRDLTVNGNISCNDLAELPRLRLGSSTLGANILSYNNNDINVLSNMNTKSVSCDGNISCSTVTGSLFKTSSGSFNLTGSFQNIYSIGSSLGTWILSLSTGAADGTGCCMLILRDGDLERVGVANNIDLSLSTGTVHFRLKSSNGSTYNNCTWSIIKLL